MKKLKSEHLAKRLPYGMEVLRPDGRTILRVTGIVNNLYIFGENGKETYGAIRTNTNKPILRPRSDLTKEIEHNGERFVPMMKLVFITGCFEGPDISRLYTNNCENPKSYEVCYNTGSPDDYTVLTIDEIDIDKSNYWVIKQLLEWHFVLDEPEGTWIDVNTLDENPYK